MAKSSNNLSGDPSQLSFQDKITFFESEADSGGSKQTTLSAFNIFPKKFDSSNSDNNPTPPQQTSSNAPATESSNEVHKFATPDSSNSSPNGIQSMFPSHQSAVKKAVNFKAHSMPEILAVYSDLDTFIEAELNEITLRKSVGLKISKSENYKEDDLKKIKDEYKNEKQRHEKEFEKFMRQSKRTLLNPFETIPEDDEDSLLDLSITSQMTRLRTEKAYKVKMEAKKQEYLLSKINRVLERVEVVTDDNIERVMLIERHYLVASARFQAAVMELRRLENLHEPLHQQPFNHKGKCVITEIMLEVKPSYFERQSSAHNEFVVVLLKYDEKVYASKAVCIVDDIRIIRFPETFLVPETFMDFTMRLEIYGTTFWRKSKSQALRHTVLRKFGFITFRVADTNKKRQGFNMIEVIKSGRMPLRKKVLMSVHQTITPDVHAQGFLQIKLANSWYNMLALLCGHLLEFNLISQDETEPMLLDLNNFDSDFVVPVASHVSKKAFTFLLKFNHYVDGDQFFLLIAAESAEDYSRWINSINKSLALIK